MQNRHADHAGSVAPHAYGRVAGDDADRFRDPISGDRWSPLWTGLARVGGVLPPAGRTNDDPWALLGGGEHASRRGRADGGAVGTIGRRIDHEGPRFDTAIAPQGYGWWYIDAFSEDALYGLTIIGFVGSVFSPYYKASGRGDPANHCAINVALYGPRGSRWTMTERSRAQLTQSRDTLAVGPSAMRWDGDALTIDINEIAVPIPRKVKGVVRLYPEQVSTTAFGLHEDGQHLWHPIAPRARVEVAMDAPGINWSGSGYFDSNFGREPLEAGFREWQWSRAHLCNDVAVIYEGERRDGSNFAMALRYDRQGVWHDAELPPTAYLPKTAFGMPRRTRGTDASVVKTWENAPFYSRSALASTMYGEQVRAVHESLSMDRFVSPITQFMLPFRMPRITR